MTGHTHTRSNPLPPRLLRLRDVLALTGISRSEIYRQMANRTFSQAVQAWADFLDSPAAA